MVRKSIYSVSIIIILLLLLYAASGCQTSNTIGSAATEDYPPYQLEFVISETAQPELPTTNTDHEKLAVEKIDSETATHQALSNIAPLNFSIVQEDMFKYSWLDEIRQLSASDIKEILMKKTVNGCVVIFYIGTDGCEYVGVETSLGWFTLFQVSSESELYDPPVYFESYEILAFDNILGKTGFKVSLGMGASFFLTVYYTLEDGQPVLLTGVNLAVETDLDGDGNMEVISVHTSSMPTCWIAKDFDGIVKYSGDIKEILFANRGAEFDEETKVFTAFWSDRDYDASDSPDNWIQKSYVYSDGTLVEMG